LPRTDRTDGGSRVLVIDDDELLRSTLCSALLSAGHEVAAAADGGAALRALDQGRVDIAVVDIVLPDKTGLEIIGELKTYYPDVRILAISGNGRADWPDFLGLARRMGADASLAKPFRPRELIAAVQRLAHDAG
jgi:DNA-binding response OmpR family regulator